MTEIETKLRGMLVKLQAIQQYYVNNPAEEADQTLLKQLEEKVAELENLYNTEQSKGNDR
jgi:hypothetical protein